MKLAFLTRESADGGHGAALAEGRLRPFAGNLGVTSDLFLCSLVINILSLALPLALLQLYDRILPNDARDTLTILVAGLGGALVLEFVLRNLRTVIAGWFGARFEHSLGCRAVRHLLHSDLASYEQDGPGNYLQRLNAISPLRDFYGSQSVILLGDLPFAALFLAAVAYLAGPLVYVPLGLIALFGILALLTGWRLRHALDRRTGADDRRFNFLIEVLSGIHTVKGVAMEGQLLRRYERLQEGSADAHQAVALHSAVTLNLSATFSHLTLFAVAGAGAFLVIGGDLTVGGLAACTTLSGRALQPLQKAVGIWTRIQTVQLARQRLRRLFSLPSEPMERRPALAAGEGKLEISGVTFQYPRTNEPILSDVTLTVEPGQMIGLMGGSGSGKTTLLYLLMGLFRPTSGTIRIDGRDLAAFDPPSVRHRISYLSHSDTLFVGSIRENITMFRPERDQDAVEAAKLVGLDDVIARMPAGYETKVGTGANDTVTPGTAQRIAIARGLVNKPDIILFDEANTALDRQADTVLQAVLKSLRGKRTVVLVSQRPSMLALADQRFEIKDGKVVPWTKPEQAPAAGEATSSTAVAGGSRPGSATGGAAA